MDTTQKSILMFAICVGALSLSTYFYYVHFWWSPVVFAASIVCCVLLFQLLWPPTAEQKAERRAKKMARLEQRQMARMAKAAKNEKLKESSSDPEEESAGAGESSSDDLPAELANNDESNYGSPDSPDRIGQSSNPDHSPAAERVHVSDEGNVTVDVESIAEAQSAKVELRQYLSEYRQKIREAVKQQKEIRARHAREIRIQEAKFKGGVAEGRFAKSMVTDAKDKARSRLVEELKPIEDARLDFENRIARINDLISQLDKYIAEKKD